MLMSACTLEPIQLRSCVFYERRRRERGGLERRVLLVPACDQLGIEYGVCLSAVEAAK